MGRQKLFAWKTFIVVTSWIMIMLMKFLWPSVFRYDEENGWRWPNLMLIWLNLSMWMLHIRCKQNRIFHNYAMHKFFDALHEDENILSRSQCENVTYYKLHLFSIFHSTYLDVAHLSQKKWKFNFSTTTKKGNFANFYQTLSLLFLAAL